VGAGCAQHVYRACGAARTDLAATTRYVHLAKGTYIFYVRAVGPGGPDKTPATRKFTISAAH
jgi:hypothetical protein